MIPEPPLSYNIVTISTSFTMASSSTTLTPTSLMPVSEKLVHTNHNMWKAQVLAVHRGVQLAGFLDESTRAPEEKLKIQKDKEGQVEEVLNRAFVA
jgi:hypothetical protein